MKKLIFAMFLLSSTVLAGETKRLAVVAQRSTFEGLEQIALIFEGERVELITNSNFFHGPGRVARVGFYESELKGKLDTRKKEIESIFRRLENSSTKVHGGGGTYLSPHRIRYFVGGHELNDGAQYLDNIIEILDTVWKLSEWKAVDGAAAKLEGDKSVNVVYAGKRTLSETKSLSDYGCKEQGPAAQKCVIPGLGTTYLARKAANRDE